MIEGVQALCPERAGNRTEIQRDWGPPGLLSY